MPPHLHKHCSAPCGINENTRVQAQSHIHTHTHTHLHSLWHCAIHLFSATAVKYTSKWSSANEQLSMHTHKAIIFYRGKISKGEWGDRGNGIEGFLGQEAAKRNGSCVSVCISLNWELYLSSFRCYVSPPVLLTPRTKTFEVLMRVWRMTHHWWLSTNIRTGTKI